MCEEMPSICAIHMEGLVIIFILYLFLFKVINIRYSYDYNTTVQKVNQSTHNGSILKKLWGIINFLPCDFLYYKIYGQN